MNDALRRMLNLVMRETGVSNMDDLTVLSTNLDPYRLSTEENHKAAKWFKERIDALGITGTIHLRGCHYAFMGEKKPNGKPYENTETDWVWLQETAAKAARWLGYVDFDRIHDGRNSPPIIHAHAPRPVRVSVEPGDSVGGRVPDAEEFLPCPAAWASPQQPYRIVMWGEKSSLEPVLKPLSREYSTDLYLSTGDQSDTYLYQIAKDAAKDGRKLIILTFSDCDPSGWNMPIAIARKMQAFRDFGIEFEVAVYRVGLTPWQVKDYIDRGDPLPSTPLKIPPKPKGGKPGAERVRVDTWAKAIPWLGLNGVEIDALATLRTTDLEALARKMLDCFFDPDLADATDEAVEEWREEATDALKDAVGEAKWDKAESAIQERIDKVNEYLEEIDDLADVVPETFEPPELVLPEAEGLGTAPKPLYDSDPPFESGNWDEWARRSFATRRLIQSKRYWERPATKKSPRRYWR